MTNIKDEVLMRDWALVLKRLAEHDTNVCATREETEAMTTEILHLREELERTQWNRLSYAVALRETREVLHNISKHAEWLRPAFDAHRDARQRILSQPADTRGEALMAVVNAARPVLGLVDHLLHVMNEPRDPRVEKLADALHHLDSTTEKEKPSRD